MPIVQIIAFRGTGGFKDPKRKQLPGLIKAGHVGIKFEGDDRIYGFHPSPKAEDDAGGEDALIDLLLQRIAQEGSWQDDSELFIQAYRLHQLGERTEVWVLDQEYSKKQYNEIRSVAMKWYNEEKMLSQYNLPKRDGTFDNDEYNCATFPVVLGIKLPINNGSVVQYLNAMKKLGAKQWHP